MKPGRPKIIPPRTKPSCETCRCLRTSAHGDPQCAAGRILDPDHCPDYKDASRERAMTGGIVGVRTGYLG
jgi:hypothetical protein